MAGSKFLPAQIPYGLSSAAPFFSPLANEAELQTSRNTTETARQAHFAIINHQLLKCRDLYSNAVMNLGYCRRYGEEWLAPHPTA
jgi:hypothetical protein